MLRSLTRSTYHWGRSFYNLVSISFHERHQARPVNVVASHHQFVGFRSSRFFSSDQQKMAENRYAADYAKVGTSSCKKCKQKLEKGSFRIAKVVTNPFTDDGGDMKQYFHPACIFETFLRARPTTKVILDTDDLENFDALKDEDRDTLKKLIADLTSKRGTPKKTPQKKKAPTTAVTTPSASSAKKEKPSSKESDGDAHAHTFGDVGDANPVMVERDNSFRQFRRLCADIAEENSYTGKTNLVATYLNKGNSGDGYKGDVYLLLKLLLPGVVKTVYNLNNKQLVKIFSQIFGTDLAAMVEDLEQGDVAETVKTFFEEGKRSTPLKKSTLSIQEVDEFLTDLSRYTREDDQQTILTQITKRCTANDLKMVVRLIKHDLRINAGARHILDGLDTKAYDAFQTSRNLKDVVERVIALRTGGAGLKKQLSVRANLMTPILPMLAEACKSVDYALKKCPNGMYAEIKYDGERVQVHKQGDSFSYFSRSLKPVMPHKVNHFKDYIPKAFPHGNDLILDSEVLLIDTKTGNPLPFGTLGAHKQKAFKEATVGLFVFDCLHINGENLMQKPIKERRKILQKNMTEIPNRILFSEMKHITEKDDLKDLMMKVFREGLEGLVMKDVNSVYEPGKRHWLKVKKDYLADGAMADSADLLVLGAYYGTGRKGGILSTFLMGVRDPATDKWKTVTKTTGFDDSTLERLQKELKPNLEKINKDYSKIPKWLLLSKDLTPDFVIKDPKKSVVWEITGAEFSSSNHHTADGISIRFPRCTKIRDDKSWDTATTLPELKKLYEESKQTADLPDVLGGRKKTPRKRKGKSGADRDATDDETSEDEAQNSDATPKKTPRKRTMDDDVAASPAKKPAKEECKFGAACYQKSPAHRAKFSHPSNASKHLPDIFRGMKFNVAESVGNRTSLCRYIVAYDGDVLSEYEKDRATHTVVNDAAEANDKDIVSADWVWRCIAQKRIVTSSR